PYTSALTVARRAAAHREECEGRLLEGGPITLMRYSPPCIKARRGMRSIPIHPLINSHYLASIPGCSLARAGGWKPYSCAFSPRYQGRIPITRASEYAF